MHTPAKTVTESQQTRSMRSSVLLVLCSCNEKTLCRPRVTRVSDHTGPGKPPHKLLADSPNAQLGKQAAEP